MWQSRSHKKKRRTAGSWSNFRSEICLIIALDFSKRTASKLKIWTVLFYHLILEFFVKSKCWEGQLINGGGIILLIHFLSDNWKLNFSHFFLEFIAAPFVMWKLLVHIFCEGTVVLLLPSCMSRSFKTWITDICTLNRTNRHLVDKYSRQTNFVIHLILPLFLATL